MDLNLLGSSNCWLPSESPIFKAFIICVFNWTCRCSVLPLNIIRGLSTFVLTWRFHARNLCLVTAEQHLKYLLLGLKMKKALASGMGTAFSLRCSSDIGRGRGPTGISGSSSSSSAAINIFIISHKMLYFMQNTTPHGVLGHLFLSK